MLAVEKIITSKLLKPGANKRIATVDRHVGIVSAIAPSSLSLRDEPLQDISAPFTGLLTSFCDRYQPVSFLTVVTSFPELEMKHPRGEVFTKAPYRHQRSRTAWVVTYKRIPSTPVYGHSV